MNQFAMLKFRNAITLVAIACLGGGLAHAQDAPAMPGAAVPVTPGMPSASDTPEATRAAAKPPANSEPRILRGDDVVIGSPKSQPLLSGAGNSYRFEEAPIVDVVHVFMREVLKVDYVLHPPITGNITMATRGDMKPDDALALLESALQANGLLMVRDSRGIYHVGRADALKTITAVPRQALPNTPIPPGFGTIIVPLQYIGASEMAAILRPMVPAEAIVRVDNVRNLLVLMGTRLQAEGWMELVTTFDVNLLKGMSVGVFPLKYASVREVEAALRLVGGGGGAVAASAPAGGGGAAAGQGGGAAAAAAAGQSALAEGNPLFGALRVMPIERINSILVVTPRAAYLDEARRWIERLDQPSDNGAEPQLFIYQVQNGNARHLASVLAGIFGGSGGAGGTANSGVSPGLSSTGGTSTGLGNNSTFGGGSSFGGGVGGNSFGSSTGSSGFGSGFGSGSSGFGSGSMGSRTALGSSGNRSQQGVTATPVAASLGSIRVMADELNNSVLIWGTKAEYSKIESALRRLDLPPTQVMIEASIMEVTLGDGLEYGLQWAFSDTHNGGQGVGTVGRASSTLTAATSAFTYTFSKGAGDVRLALQALADKSLLKVISSPTLMVLDNHTAAINVGTQQPIKSSTTRFGDSTSAATTSSVQYKDTGVNLVVTPSVNAGNIVSMQIDQTLTDIGQNVAAADDQPNFLQRQISSKVAVRTGQTIVLGGLIRDTDRSSRAGVPLLADVPVLGALFSNRKTNKDRTELLVIITPRVVRTDIDIREVSEDLRDRLKGLRSLDDPLPSATAPLPARAVVPVAPQ